MMSDTITSLDQRGSSDIAASESPIEERSNVAPTDSTDSPYSSADQPPLLQPCASRLISCLRAPCLKRQASGHTSPLGSTPPSSGAVSPVNSGSIESGSGSETNKVSSYSFASIKRVLAATPKRQVHFDAAPPEAGITYSRDNYDRRPIECTRGGSSFDLSLPPRGMCPSYSGEADDERCGEAEEGDDEDCHKERIRGFARWARLKNGGTIFGGATLRFAPSKAAETATQATASPSEPREPDSCSVPVHGIRSFGGLAGSIGHDDEVQATQQEVAPKGRRRALLSEMGDEESERKPSGFDADMEDANMDEEHVAFRQAVYRALSMSPNATPMPSPSVRTRWECVTSYFQTPTADVETVKPAAEDEAAAFVDRDASPEEVKTPVAMQVAALRVSDAAVSLSSPSPSSNEATPSSTETATPLTMPTTTAMTKISPSSSAESSNAHSSSSPMSSRCSSVDTWSSPSGREAEVDEFERSFGKTVGELRIPQRIILAAQSSTDPSEEATTTTFVLHGEASDSADGCDEHAISSSSTISGSGGDWVSSCATSPDLPSSDDLPSSIKSDGGFNLDAVTNSPVKKGSAEEQRSAFAAGPFSSPNKPSSASPAFLSPARRAISHSAPGSAIHSPYMLSADEAENETEKGKLLATPSLQRSNSCSRKTRIKQRRFASTGDSHADSDDNAVARPRRCTSNQRSKSMSSAGATIKKTSFTASSFRSEIEDEGALGGF